MYFVLSQFLKELIIWSQSSLFKIYHAVFEKTAWQFNTAKKMHFS